MKVPKPTLMGCLAIVSLTCAASLYSAMRAKLSRFSVTPHIFSTLEQDELLLAGDMRTLRKNLRRHASQARIAAERDAIRRDWINIVVDRGLGSARYSSTLASISPYCWPGAEHTDDKAPHP